LIDSTTFYTFIYIKMTTTVPVGLDLSSLYCRVAVDGRIGVVSNTQGARWTLGLVAKEEGETDFVFGDAALRLPHETVAEAIANNNMDAAQAFLAYVIQLAADNAAVGVEQLRLVITIPAAAAGAEAVWMECVGNACKGLISDKKKRKEDFVVGVVTKTAAVCVAHDKGAVVSQKVLVVDMDGDAPLTLTVLEQAGGFYVELSTKCVEDVSGPALLTLLATHVATHFERQNKVPRGEVMQSKKAKAKLMKEAERTLMSAGSAMTFMLDGLFEGMDCHVNVSKPRWDMMTGALLRQVEAALAEVGSDIDTIYLSGAWAAALQPTLDKALPGKTASSVMPTEEVVVLGCAKNAGLVLAKNGLPPVVATTRSVTVSPVSIGLGEDVILIAEGTPLPAKVEHSVTSSCKVFQLGASKVELADLNDISEATMMIMELSTEGQLSIGFAGQPMVTI
jgi:hypothetical protein